MKPNKLTSFTAIQKNDTKHAKYI